MDPGEASAKQPADTEKLNDLLQTLPQELYDEIQEYTFTINQPVEIDWDYRQPAVLRVDHTSREGYAASYHRDCTFHNECLHLSAAHLFP